MKPLQKLIIRLPRPLLSELRALAASRNRSMSSLIIKAIEELLEKDRSRTAKDRFLKRIQSSPDRGTHGKVKWTREQLHKR